jgi:membrane protein DedA with SNARE-associated domain
MNDTAHVLAQYGYVVLFSFVLAEQTGLPIPAAPALLAVGALLGGGRMSPALALGVAVVASLPPDIVWYELGRRRGGRVLGLICRISLEPDSCVHRTETLFVRLGWRALVIAKFLPGLSTLVPPLAGVVGFARGPFVLLDSVGALVWAGTWMGVGFVFRDALDLVAAKAARVGNGVLVVVAAALAMYVIIKFIRRRRFFRRLRMARITPDELKRLLDDGDGKLAIIDTRSALDVSTVPYAIPGAIWIPSEDIDRRGHEVPRDREVVLYCS